MARYVHGDVDDVEAFAVEAHVKSCDDCRRRMAEATAPGRPDHIWASVLDIVDAPERGWFERLLVRAGLADHIARVLAATPSMRRSWVTAATVALAFSVLAAYQGEGGILLFLTLAPLLPVAGVAFGYGPGVDPTYEIGLAAPMNGFGLLLLRAAAVLTTTLALATLAALALPDLDWRSAAWLLPGLGLTVTSLALATAITPERAAALVSGGWVVAVLAAEGRSSESLAAFRAPGQVTVAVLALASTVLVIRRQRVFDMEGASR